MPADVKVGETFGKDSFLHETPNATGMILMGILSTFLFNRRSKVKEKANKRIFPFITFFLCVSSGFGEDKSPDCKPEFFGICSSPCNYFQKACDADLECFLNLCAYLYRQEHDQLRLLYRCKDLIWECAESVLIDQTKSPKKRGILNKNFAYLLLKLHPFFNQTSQFGFLTSGRIRRITGNFGTEFLGKRSNNDRSGKGKQVKVRPTAKPTFYSLPLNKFSQVKILKKNYEYPEYVEGFHEKRTPTRGGNGAVILGSEFLGKRGSQEFEMVLSGDPDESGRPSMKDKRTGELLPVVGSEFLGKRNGHLIHGSELLGKRNNRYHLGEFLGKKLLRNRLRKQTGNELLGKKSQEPKDLYGTFWLGYGPEIAGEDPGQEPNVEELSLCKQNNFSFEFCRQFKTEDESKSN